MNAWECATCGRVCLTELPLREFRHLSRYEARYPVGDERQWCYGPELVGPSARKDAVLAAYLLGGLAATLALNGDPKHDEATDCPTCAGRDQGG